MVVFPGCKINLGLHVLARRADGYHDVESAMVPIGWCDALEAVTDNAYDQGLRLTQSGYTTTSSIHENLVYKAWKLLADAYTLPPIRAHLHKRVPMGAGLGGGSADAAEMLKVVNKLAGLKLDDATLKKYAALLGSDCAFFIRNEPALATGRGEILHPLKIDLSKYHILLIHPGVHSSTASAYASVTPSAARTPLKKILNSPIREWRRHLVNDFEPGIFRQFPQVAQLKARMYEAGALYAAMSGSGSTIFGIFETSPPQNLLRDNYFLQRPSSAA